MLRFQPQNVETHIFALDSRVCLDRTYFAETENIVAKSFLNRLLVSWDPFLMKKLLKSKICGSREQCTGLTDMLKMAEKSKFLATVHAQQPESK